MKTELGFRERLLIRAIDDLEEMLRDSLTPNQALGVQRDIRRLRRRRKYLEWLDGREP